MKIAQHDHHLEVTDIPELSAATAGGFRHEIEAALSPASQALEIDLSQTRYMDSSGLGALFAVYRYADGLGGVTVRLRNPPPPVQ